MLELRDAGWMRGRMGGGMYVSWVMQGKIDI